MWDPIAAAADRLSALARSSLLTALPLLGPIPSHVAFIMDGNRRFARAKNELALKGHESGFTALEATLDWCLTLGVKTVSVYAFSIENFNRNKAEVDGLMDLARRKFEEFATKSAIIEKHGIAVRVIGKTELLPPEVQLAASRAVLMTRHNNRAVLNICMPYTSRAEITEALSASLNLPATLSTSLITPDLLAALLQTQPSPPPDLLVRTSGETRLSDFLLWQASEDCDVWFVDRLWPEFNVWDFLPAVLWYQVKVFSGGKRERGGEGEGQVDVVSRSVSLARSRMEEGNTGTVDGDAETRDVRELAEFVEKIWREREQAAVRLAVEAGYSNSSNAVGRN
ncbi:hypothetical protein DFJ73DRAFT_631200 [Zopfochytrium polystomum]|nr:hypothetical protein DFJ73DRAFT_631200 [Zopfochytrium polystomum]